MQVHHARLDIAMSLWALATALACVSHCALATALAYVLALCRRWLAPRGTNQGGTNPCAGQSGRRGDSTGPALRVFQLLAGTQQRHLGASAPSCERIAAGPDHQQHQRHGVRLAGYTTEYDRHCRDAQAGTVRAAPLLRAAPPFFPVLRMFLVALLRTFPTVCVASMPNAGTVRATTSFFPYLVCSKYANCGHTSRQTRPTHDRHGALLHTAHCTLHTAHHMARTAHTLQTVHPRLHTARCTLHATQYTLHMR